MFRTAFWRARAFLSDLGEIYKHKPDCAQHYIEEILWKRYIKKTKYQFNCKCHGG